MKLIPLTQGQFAKVDDEDFERLGRLRWYASYCKHSEGFYACRSEVEDCSKTHHYLHRVVMRASKGVEVDHINHDTLDNQKANLRICTSSQNHMNQNGPYANSKSGVRGVYWHKGAGRWTAMLRLNKRGVYLGLFDSIEEASAAYKSANLKHFGEFGGKL